MPVELVSLLVIAAIALGLYVFPLPGQRGEDGLKLAFSGFGHHALVTICALMVMGRGLVVTGALDPLVTGLSRVWKLSQWLGLLLTLLMAFALSMMVNDTPVLVLLLPVLVQLATRGAMPSSRTLMPLNAAILIGGMGTTIGTSTNLLVVSIAEDLGLPHMTVFHFTPLVLIAGLIALPYLWLVMPRLLPDNRITNVKAERRFVTTLRIDEGSDYADRPIAELKARLPEGIVFERPPPAILRAPARLVISGPHDALEEATRRAAARLAPADLLNAARIDAVVSREDLAVAECAITAESRLVGLTIAEAGFTEADAVAIIGLAPAPRGPVGPGDMASVVLGEGDLLLVMGTAPRIRELAARDALLLLEGVKEVPRRAKATLALGIMAAAVGCASLGLLPIAIAALGGAIVMFATGCVRFDRVGRALSAHVIVLVAASIALGRFVLETGAAEWLAQVLVLGLQYLPAAGVLAAIMLFVTVLTNLASNATAAAVGTPIAFSVAQQLAMPPEPLVLAVLFGCNLCYATPVAYQTNMLIMAEGGYRFRDYLRSGLPLIGIMVVTLSVLLVVRYKI
ncbi:SLC13 family permease [Parablastomonas sp. CN1-191]|uniref:SLC13 family permease n=1 Tax=Parablastomonas sp. CN1-191 TaxID=3400908 RepID=UPI003BF8B278